MQRQTRTQKRGIVLQRRRTRIAALRGLLFFDISCFCLALWRQTYNRVAHWKSRSCTKLLSQPKKLPALIDSGATASYVDEGIVREHQIETTRLERPIIVYNADGTENINGRIEHTCTLRLRIGNHEEERLFFVTQLDSHRVFLGHDWLLWHNPTINWKNKDVQFNRCPDACDYIPKTVNDSLP